MLTLTRSSIVVAALAAFFALGAPAHAMTVRGVTFPDTTTVGGKAVQLNGMGVRTAYIFVKVYVAGLYLEKKTSDPQSATQTDEPKRMLLQFLREVSHEEMVNAMKEGFAHTASAALKPQVDQFSGFFTEPLKEGSQASFDYVPGTGTTVTIAGQLKGTIPGVEFMQALWGIWLGDPPADANLKTALLGQS
jgi:hypothetical protein